MRDTLIQEIISLDADTHMGIDDPAFLQEMTISQLEDYLANMYTELEGE